MQCIIHPDQEAVDACHTCGKPICAACGAASGSRFVCPRCAPAVAGAAPAETDPGAAGGAQRSPALAALLSFFPGLGQAYNGDWLRGLAFLILIGVLGHGASHAPGLGVFVALVWFYQVYQAYHAAATAGEPVPPARPERAPRLAAWGLVAAGALLFLENLTGALLPQLRVLLPAAVILAGLRVLISYFRTGEEAPR